VNVHKFEELLQTEMTRKQFLRAMGAGVLAICGFSALMRALNGPASSSQLSGDYGYGDGNYGGIGDPKAHQVFSR
jgi:hypothetical protein